MRGCTRFGTEGHLGFGRLAHEAPLGEGGATDAAEGAVTQGKASTSTQRRDFSGPGLLRAGGLTHHLRKYCSVL